jgi:hypothetical protein
VNQYQLFTCPDCNLANKTRGLRSVIFTCTACGAVLANETGLDIPKMAMPDDWSIIQVGTTGTYNKKGFEVVGRVRMQMRKEYKNYWCLWFPVDMKYAWLVESLGFYAMCTDIFFEVDQIEVVKKIRANTSFQVSEKTSVTIDEVDFCEILSFSGEINTWSYGNSFFVAQGKNGPIIAAFIHFSAQKDRVKFLAGEWVPVESLQLKNINTTHVW